MSRASDPPAAAARLRIDKWLWAARFYRTRTLAAAAIDAGHVRVGGERVKPAQPVAVGSTVEVRRQKLAWTVVVTAVAERRGSAKDAALLYRETDESVAAREKLIAERNDALAARGRPTKRDRRKLEDFLNEP